MPNGDSTFWNFFPCRAGKLDAVNTPNERISTWWDNFVSETDLEKAWGGNFRMRQRSLYKLADGLKNIQIRVDGALIKLLSIHFYQVISRTDSLHATYCSLNSVIFLYLRIGLHYWPQVENPDNIHKRISPESCDKSADILRYQLNIRCYLKSKFRDNFFVTEGDV